MENNQINPRIYIHSNYALALLDCDMHECVRQADMLMEHGFEVNEIRYQPRAKLSGIIIGGTNIDDPDFIMNVNRVLSDGCSQELK